MCRILNAARPALLLALLAVLAACNTKDQHGSQTQFNAILKGQYWYVNFARAVATTVQPTLQARVGLVQADGEDTLTFGPNFGSPLKAKTRTYLVNANRQIDNTSNEPGATLPGGEFFELADLDRQNGNDVGLMFCQRHGASLTINDLIDTGALSGFYHAVFLRFDPFRQIQTGIGNATLTKNTTTTASWAIDVTLANRARLLRQGSMLLAAQGSITANDVTVNRTYTGFAEPHGDWLIWMETDASAGQVFRMDLLIRKGKGMSEASLNGRFNLVGFYQSSTQLDVDALFGRLVFDGRGSYFDFTTRNSFGRASTTGNQVFAYDVAPDGVITFLGGSNPIGFATRSAARRWFIFPDVDPNGALGFFVALRR